MTTAPTADQAMQQFEHTTSRWGRLTMSAVLITSLAAPILLLVLGDFGVTFNQLLTAYLAVAAVYLVLAIVEPITYFPILGQAAMYQAFMIGNIANKLLPAAIVAQNRVAVRPGSRQGDLVAVMAICGAAVVHVVSLLLFVGIFGTWLLSVVPEPVIEVAQLYILPSILGAVVVQALITVKQARSALFAAAASLFVVFALVPLVPAVGAFGVAIVVLLTILASWFLRNKAHDDRLNRPETPEAGQD
ncbi:MAG: hypothetical protein Q4F53_10075 [Nesterenkonia sp.]|nr:hypothetical protein [Nesterenkonia sp.]